jgi:hypothetical protein
MTNEKKLDGDYYLKTGMANFQQMSRTVRGTLDISSSADKASKMESGLTGESAAKLAKQNLETALLGIWFAHGLQVPDVAAFQNFLEALADTVNAGIVKSGNRLRSGADSTKYLTYGLTATLPEEFNAFVERFHDWLAHPHDAVELAAWVEYRADLADHFFADGCGKIAKLYSAYVLMRAGLPLPNYPERSAYYANGPKIRRTEPDPAKDPEFQRFLAVYRTWVDCG